MNPLEAAISDLESAASPGRGGSRGALDYRAIGLNVSGRTMLTVLRISLATISLMAATGMPGRVQAEHLVPSAAGLANLSRFFDGEVAGGRIPGAVVLIQQHGLPIYLKCFGNRDPVTKAPMTPDTVFALHSMTKPITSLAAMMLVDEGRLSLTDPLSRYIPMFAAAKVAVVSKAGSGVGIRGGRACSRLSPITRDLSKCYSIVENSMAGDISVRPRSGR